MDEELTKRILKEQMMADDATDHADAAAQEFVSAVAQSMDELEKRIVEVTGIKGDDDDPLVVGRVTFSPEVERVRKGLMPGLNDEGCVRKPHGPLNRPIPSLEGLLDIFTNGMVDPHKEVPTSTTDDAEDGAPFGDELEEALNWTDPDEEDGLLSAEELRRRHDAGWTLTPKGRIKAGLDKHVPTPAPPEGTPHKNAADDWLGKYRGSLDEPKTQETLGDGIDGGGKRMNAGKLRIELIPPEWFVALADVMTQGSKKYKPRNWEQGMKWSTMIGSMKRHIAKFEAGERYDGLKFDLDEGTTGCHHLAMIAWNALALMSYDLRAIGTNDLPDDDGLTLLKRVNAGTSDKGNSIHDDDM